VASLGCGQRVGTHHNPHKPVGRELVPEPALPPGMVAGGWALGGGMRRVLEAHRGAGSCLLTVGGRFRTPLFSHRTVAPPAQQGGS
jgi:hypothetical protein